MSLVERCFDYLREHETQRPLMTRDGFKRLQAATNPPHQWEVEVWTGEPMLFGRRILFTDDPRPVRLAIGRRVTLAALRDV